ncbi:hypothetical protein BD626DRAFT_59237 [Schizophyllum amplum]|uniref:Uncharacterized protein n=1 Tax=Schizophyllum amplum TaxID=97359 RepID=A0A550CBU1_9AGAR|nr:hypothetical protein BD626DRAFT_59237 [Auriculariopsis ampla]
MSSMLPTQTFVSPSISSELHPDSTRAHIFWRLHCTRVRADSDARLCGSRIVDDVLTALVSLQELYSCVAGTQIYCMRHVGRLGIRQIPSAPLLKLHFWLAWKRIHGTLKLSTIAARRLLLALSPDPLKWSRLNALFPVFYQVHRAVGRPRLDDKYLTRRRGKAYRVCSFRQACDLLESLNHWTHYAEQFIGTEEEYFRRRTARLLSVSGVSRSL